jgi:hypothetical protein
MVGLTLDNPGMEKPRLWINRRLSPSSSADGRPSPSLYVPQVRDFVHLPHTTHVVAQCTASCRLLLSPRARYVSVSGAICSSIFDAFPPALIRFALLRNGGKRARRAIRAASRAILGRARGGELRSTRARLLPAVCPPLAHPRASSDAHPALRQKVRRLIPSFPVSHLPIASTGLHRLQGHRAHHPRGGRPRGPQGPRGCQEPHLRHEVPHQDPGGYRSARGRRRGDARPPRCVRDDNRPSLTFVCARSSLARAPRRVVTTRLASVLTPTAPLHRRPQRRALREDRYASGASTRDPPARASPSDVSQGLG